MDDILAHPEVKQYLALVRLQVLTPLSLLINIAAVIVCSAVTNPTIGQILKLYPTALSPNPSAISTYVFAIFIAQLGYCLLLVLARKDETKKTLTQGVGLSLVIANWTMALWAIAWVMRWFLLSTILQGILLLVLLYSNLVLLIYHPPTWDRPFDMMLIHAPLRFFLVLQLSLMFPLSLFVQLKLTYTPTPDAPGEPVETSDSYWPGFGVVLGTNLLGMAVVALRGDIVWSVAATWISVALWSQRPKPGPVFIAAIVFTALHPLTLLAGYIYSWFFAEQPIVLRGEEEHPGVHPPEDRHPRAIDPEADWA